MREWGSCRMYYRLSQLRKLLKGISNDTGTESHLIDLAFIGASYGHMETNTDSVLNKAHDLSFGSTLEEQLSFTHELTLWVRSCVVNNLKFSGDSTLQSKVADILRKISAWQTIVCLPIEVQSAADDTRVRMSYNICIRQIRIIKLVILEVMRCKSLDIGSILKEILWNVSDGGVASGLLPCLRLISSIAPAGNNNAHLTYFLESEIARVLVDIIDLCDHENTVLLVNLGAVTQIVSCVRHGISIIRKISRQPSDKIDINMIESIYAETVEIFGSLVRKDNEFLHQSIVNSGLLSFLIADCLKDIRILGSSGLSFSSHLRLPVRCLAISLLSLIVCSSDVTAMLLKEFNAQLSFSNAFEQEVKLLRGQCSSKFASVIKSSAVELLAMCVASADENTDSLLQVFAYSNHSLCYIEHGPKCAYYCRCPQHWISASFCT